MHLAMLHRLPMFGFAGLGFLMLGVILAVACWLAFRSGKEGTTKLGGLAGCFIALALVFVAGIGALGCVAIAVVNAPDEIVRRGPIRRIETVWPDARAEHESEPDPGGMHIRIEMTGGDEAQISRWFREHTEGDVTFTVESIQGPDGPRTRIDVRIPISADEMRDLRRDLERDLPNLNLPSGVNIELRGEDD